MGSPSASVSLKKIIEGSLEENQIISNRVLMKATGEFGVLEK
jgi:hypothetical protein